MGCFKLDVFFLKRPCIGIIVAIALYFRKKTCHLDLRTAGCLFKGFIWPNEIVFHQPGFTGHRSPIVIVITYGAPVNGRKLHGFAWGDFTEFLTLLITGRGPTLHLLLIHICL